MNRVRAAFASLDTYNFRLFFVGQAISVTGTWMQKIGQAWLVLELTGSGTLLGATAALQHLPTLFIGPWGGLLADRLDKRKVLYVTSALAGVLALVLGLLTATDRVELWIVLVMAPSLGVVEAIDKPTRQAFVIEMVRPAQLMNAVTLASVVQNTGKVAGPALAGALIASLGLASSFLLNAASYLAVLTGLLLMRRGELHPAPPARRASGQLRAGLRHVRHTPELLGPLVLMTVVGMMAFEWMVTLPLFASETFGGGADAFGLMFSVMGLGAILGGMLVAGTVEPTTNAMAATMGVLGVAMVVVSLTPTFPAALAVLFVVGGASVAAKAVTTALIQLHAAPEMRGRVMGLLVVTIGGTTPIGGPLVGWIGEVLGPRFALGQGGVVAVLAAAATVRYLRRAGTRTVAPAATG